MQTTKHTTNQTSPRDIFTGFLSTLDVSAENRNAPDADVDGYAGRVAHVPGMKSGHGAAQAGTMPEAPAGDPAAAPRCRALSLRARQLDDAGTEAGDTPPGSMAGGAHLEVRGPGEIGENQRGQQRLEKADASLAGSSTSGGLKLWQSHSQQEFMQIARSVKKDVSLLRQQLAQACQGRRTLRLVLSDFDRSLQQEVLDCLFAEPHWKKLQLDMGRRTSGWDHCLGHLSMLVRALPHHSRRTVLLDFGQGSLTCTGAPEILRTDAGFLTLFGALRFSKMELRGQAMQALMSAIANGAGEKQANEASASATETTLAGSAASGPADGILHGFTLRELSLVQPYVDARDLDWLFMALGSNTGLSELTLGCFPLRQNVAALATALRQNRGIASLSLKALRPDSVGTQQLIESLCTRNEMLSLDISGNNISADDLLMLACWLHGADTEAAAQPALEKLAMVDLREHGNNYDTSFHDHARQLHGRHKNANPWTQAVGIALATVLEKNRQLLSLDLNRNPLAAPTTEALLAGLAGNTTLQELHINGAAVSLAAVAALDAAMVAREAPLLLEIEQARCAPQANLALQALAKKLPALELVWGGDARQPAPLQKQVSQPQSPSGRR